MNESPRTPSGGEAEKLVRSLAKIRASADLPLDALDEFRAAYLAAPRDVRESFFSLLLVRMEVSREAVETPLRSVLEAPSGDPVEWTSLLTDLRRTLESPRMRVFRRFLNVSGGLKFLLDLRADVLAAERQSELDLAPIDEEISYLFNSWFQYGFLFLQEITQDSSYRQIHFLKGHDMVHPMARLEEMGNRLGEDRRSFALYHRAMPEEPIVFIEAALTRRIPRSIHEILDDPGKSPETDPDTAIFYSINNAQNGLVGLGLGKLLIFQVVDAIKKNRPQIQTFATLSPVTGFWGRYLQRILQGEDRAFRLKKKDVVKHFSQSARRHILGRGAKTDSDFASALLEILSSPGWIEDPILFREVRRPLTQIAYFYLTEERGLKDSCGIMVSYVYSSTWLHQLRRSARAMLPWKV